MSGSERAGREEVWIEKYRPRRLEDILGQDAIVERLESYVARDDLPHMLFAGRAGIGKCATGETPILTDDGIARMETIVGDVEGIAPIKDGPRILTLQQNGSFEYVEPSHRFSKLAEDIVEIQTRDGADLSVTPEHKLLVCTSEGLSWRTASDLGPGDRLVRPLDAPLPETDPELDWINRMDGERTLVYLDPDFAYRQGIPFASRFVDIEDEVTHWHHIGLDTEQIANRVELSPEAVRRLLQNVDEDESRQRRHVCTLSSVRTSDCPRAALKEHVEAVESLPQSDDGRSGLISPVWSVDSSLARLLGLLVAKGQIGDSRIEFSHPNKNLRQTVMELLEEVFGVEATHESRDTATVVAGGNRTLAEFLRSCFEIFPEPAEDAAIGSSLLSAPRDARAAFLQALFDATGKVTDSGAVQLRHPNSTVITLVSYLLAGFGIPSSRASETLRTSQEKGAPSQNETLTVSGNSHTRRFRDVCGFSIQEKAERLSKATHRSNDRNYDSLPEQAALGKLCSRLHLDRIPLIQNTLEPPVYDRKQYSADIERVLDAATTKLDRVQEALAELDVLEFELQRLRTQVRAGAEGGVDTYTNTGHRLPSSDSPGFSGGFEGYPREKSSLATDRTRLKSEVADDASYIAGEEQIRNSLSAIIEELEIPHPRVAEQTTLQSGEIGQVLGSEMDTLRSRSRVQSVVAGLRNELAEMASMETLDLLSTLHRVIEPDIYLDEVRTIERDSGNHRVYDLTVPESRNYVAGAVPTVMHNTTAAQAVARELYGEDWEEHFLELNASDERGIDVVRDRIKSFARTSFGGANYRIIFLDEADALTSDAQAALRRTMEQFSNNVRFILSCNYSSQIIDPIQSRCAVFRFSPLSDESVEEQIRRIAEAEGIEVTQDGVDALVYAADGDMRRAINGLQAAAVTEGPVDAEAVYEITSTARPEDIREMVTRALDGDFTGARSELDRLLTEEGIAGGDILDQLHRAVWEFDLSDEAAVRVLDRIGEADYRITEGANERIQLEALLASLALD